MPGPEWNDYMANYMKQRRRKRRKEMEERLGGSCLRCGGTERLNFDHIDPSTKLMEVSSARALDGPMERLIAEVGKCQLLCHSHHVEKTREDREAGGGQNYIANPEHGTAVMYGREKCRCGPCRSWKKKYRAGEVDSLGRPR